MKHETATSRGIEVTLSYQGESDKTPHWKVYTGPYPGEKELAVRRIEKGRNGWVVCEFDRTFYTFWRPIESGLTLTQAKERAVVLLTERILDQKEVAE